MRIVFRGMDFGMVIGMAPIGNDYRGLALVGTAVAEMVAPILLGIWIDQRFGWSPGGLIVGALVGIVGGMAHLIWISRRDGGHPPGPPDERGGP